MLKTDVIQKALLREPSGKFLILRRSKTDTRRPLQWDLPGGTLDDGESLTVGIKREILEESNLEVAMPRLVYSKTEHRKWDDGESNVVFLFYYAQTDSDEVMVSSEHDMYRWVEFDDLFEIYEYDTHLEVFRYIKEKQLEL